MSDKIDLGDPNVAKTAEVSVGMTEAEVSRLFQVATVYVEDVMSQDESLASRVKSGERPALKDPEYIKNKADKEKVLTLLPALIEYSDPRVVELLGSPWRVLVRGDRIYSPIASDGQFHKFKAPVIGNGEASSKQVMMAFATTSLDLEGPKRTKFENSLGIPEVAYDFAKGLVTGNKIIKENSNISEGQMKEKLAPFMPKKPVQVSTMA